MTPNAIEYFYRARAGSGTMTSDDRDWLIGKRIQRITVITGTGASAVVDIYGSPSPNVTDSIAMSAGQTLCLGVDGAGLTSINVTLTGTGRWLMEAWVPA